MTRLEALLGLGAVLILSLSPLGQEAQAAALPSSHIARTVIVVTAKEGKDQVRMGLDLDANGDIVDLVVDPDTAPLRYGVAQLRNEADIDVENHTGVLFIKTPGLDPAKGGPVYIRWTKNIVFGGGGSIGVYLFRNAQGDWNLYVGPKVVKTLLVKSNLMGIDSITPLLSLLNTLTPLQDTAVAKVELDLRSGKEADYDMAEASIDRVSHHVDPRPLR